MRSTTSSRMRHLAAGVVMGLLVVAQGLVASTSAEAALLDTPARTWGVGPADPTAATDGSPRVLAILPVGDRIVVAGTFDSVIDPAGKLYPAKNIAVFSASTGAADLTFAGSANNTVTSLATDGTSTVYLGGTFGAVNGEVRKGLAALDLNAGGQVLGWAPTIVAPGQVDSLTYAGGAVFAGGNFAGITSTVAGTSATSRPYLAKVDGVTGAVAGSWVPTPNDRVRSVTPAVDGTGRLFVGGDFTTVSGRASTNKIAAVAQAGTGALDPTFKAVANSQKTYSPVYDLVSDGTRLYSAVGGSGGACTAMSATTGALAWSDRSNGNLQSVRLSGGLLYCGGHFSGTGSFAGQARQKLAAVTPATGALTAFAPNINSSQGVWAMASDATRVYIGGDFSSVSGTPQPHFAMFIDSAAQTAPQAPAGVVAAGGDAVVHLSWSPPSSDGGSALTKYRLYRATTPGGENLAKTPLASLSKTTLAYDDLAVTNGTTYYYVLVATNALGTSPTSPEVVANPHQAVVLTAPGAPTGVTAAAAPGSVNVSWSPPASTGGTSITQYRVYRGTTAGGEDLTTPVATTTGTTVDVPTSTAGQTYWYVVTAVNAVGEGPASAEASAVSQAGGPGECQLSGSIDPTGAPVLTWTIPADGGSPITKYVVLRDSVRLVTLSATPTGPTTYTDTTLTPGSTGVYQVKAVNAVGSGPLSSKVTLTAP
ncbi:fibronectin type III domain-containing protein [Phycicoccus sp. Soil748]|uniref:fibronectin type III domain-containing protein n=1 Tax=Phycicoccus sp. Soil748 TaxID=1736397 RepID=UPI000AA9EBA6|nr:fibronectin type III domain-containing protein [Phycicoccus sp. Soil748]